MGRTGRTPRVLHPPRPFARHGHRTGADGRRSVYTTDTEPDRTLLIRCGNRRASVCPSCSYEYAGDMWQFLYAGAAGGRKGVPDSIRAHPLVFATLTAPGFGPVHTTRTDRRGGPGRCRPPRGKPTLCPHGRSTWCTAIHDEADQRLGQHVASELVTVVDDGTIANRRGSLNVDDEGVPTRRNVLIEKGILRGYMQDRLNSRLMGMEVTGNGRRESYAHPPMPRMTNTFMLAGEDEPADILRGVSKGLYAVNFGGGQVDITSGRFVFSASEAYLIEDGRVTKPVKGATLIGNGPEALTRVSRVGHDLKLDEGVGTCGKDGQSVPVGVGLPTIRIDGMTVGGTQV